MHNFRLGWDSFLKTFWIPIANTVDAMDEWPGSQEPRETGSRLPIIPMIISWGILQSILIGYRDTGLPWLPVRRVRDSMFVMLWRTILGRAWGKPPLLMYTPSTLKVIIF
jgi:hypothetical protein